MEKFKQIIFGLIFGGIAILLFFYSFLPLAAFAESYTVTGQVPSQVSKENSTVETNIDKTLADPVNHPILITISLQDKNGAPLVHKIVQITSSRGSVDIIEAVSKVSDIKARAAEDIEDEMRKDFTDDNGKVSFRITSFTPGKAKIVVLADGVIKLSDNEIEFEPLPFPIFLSIVVKLPNNKELVLMSGDYQNEYLSDYQRQVVGQINPKTKLIFPFWFFILFLAVIISIFLLIIMNLINFYRFRKVEKIERKLTTTVVANQASIRS